MSPRKKAKKEGRPVRGKSKPKQQNGGQSGEAGEEVAAILLPTDELLGPDAEGDAAVIQQAALDALNALFAGQDALDAAAAPEEEELPAPQPPEPTSGGRRDGTTAPTAPDTLGAVAAAPRVFGTAEVQAVVQGRRDVQPPNTTNAYESRLKKHLQVCLRCALDPHTAPLHCLPPSPSASIPCWWQSGWVRESHSGACRQ